MAFEKMGAFTFNHAGQPDELNVAADIAKANFDSRANELKTALNKVVDLLNATTDGASGADNVGATAVDGLTGKTVQTILEEIKTLVDTKETPTGAQTKANTAESSAKTYADGQVGDLAGTGRTTETVKGNADALSTHLANIVTDVDGVHGLQIEEGTWTPNLKGTTVAGTNTYTTQIGTYYKINKLVQLSFELNLSAKDANMEGELCVGDLPFTIGSSRYNAFSISSFNGINLSDDSTRTYFTLTGQGNKVFLRRQGMPATTTGIKVACAENNFHLRGTGVIKLA